MFISSWWNVRPPLETITLLHSVLMSLRLEARGKSLTGPAPPTTKFSFSLCYQHDQPSCFYPLLIAVTKTYFRIIFQLHLPFHKLTAYANLSLKSKYFGTPLVAQWLRIHLPGFPGGAVVENLPANAGDTGSSPGLGRSHMPRSS